MFHFADVLRLLERLKDEGVVADYALAGAMAANFWTRPLRQAGGELPASR